MGSSSGSMVCLNMLYLIYNEHNININLLMKDL